MRIEQFISGGAADRLTDVLLLVGLDGMILDANDAALDCYGYSRAEMLDLHIRDIRAEHDQADIDTQMQQAGASGARFVALHRRHDGTAFPVEVSSALVDGDDGSALLSIITDITERKRAEKAVRESEALSRTLFEQSVRAEATAARERTVSALLNAITESALLIDAGGEIIALNETAAARTGGVSAAELVGKNAFDYLDPNVAESRRELFAEVARTGRPVTFEDIRDGRHMINSLFPVLVDGCVTQIAVFAYDMTELEERALALRESEESLHAILQSTADGILAADVSGTVLFASDRFAEMWNAPPDVVATNDDIPLLEHCIAQVSDAEAFREKVMRLYDSDEESLDIVELKDGRVFERLSLPLNREGRPRARVWSFRDITTRMQVEQMLHRQATTDELTGVVNRRRFFELAQTELKRAARLHQPLAVAFIDVDRLKHVNDRFGHAAGDRVLVAFAAACQEHVREIDVLARIGGDEFALLLPSATLDEAVNTVERVRAALTALTVDSASESLAITVSAGVAGLTGDDDTLDLLLMRADRALYRAKELGRDRAEVDSGVQ